MSSVLFTEAETRFRDEVRKFVVSELAPVSEEIERKEDFSLIRKFIASMGYNGFLGSCYPAKYGGTEKGIAYEVIVAEEVSAVSLGTDMSRAASTIFYSMPVFKFGNEEQKKYLVPVIQRIRRNGFISTASVKSEFLLCIVRAAPTHVCSKLING